MNNEDYEEQLKINIELSQELKRLKTENIKLLKRLKKDRSLYRFNCNRLKDEIKQLNLRLLSIKRCK